MLLAPHILVGAAVASSFQNPLLGILFAFLSHFLMDRIPHWEYSIKPLKHIKERGIRYCMPIILRVLLDVVLGFSILILAVIISSNYIPLWAWALGGFFGILPDGLTFLLFLVPRGGLLSKLLKLVYIPHHALHYNKKMGLPPLRIGLSTQVIASLLSLYFLIA